MNNFNPVHIYQSAQHTYTAVHFEDLNNKWYIRCDAIDGGQTWSQEGYDSPGEASRAFDGRVVYVEQAPGASA